MYKYIRKYIIYMGFFNHQMIVYSFCKMGLLTVKLHHEGICMGYGHCQEMLW